MRFYLQAATAAAIAAISSHAIAGQPIFLTPAGTPVLPTVLYELGYATSGPFQTSAGIAGFTDTLVSIGLPSKATVKLCNIQVAWFDWNGALAGVSGPDGGLPLTPGMTLEFTTDATGNPGSYQPFQQNIFRDTDTPFEGYAQIRTDTTCPKSLLRVDAEFATQTQSGAGGPPVVNYKVINVMAPAGAKGY